MDTITSMKSFLQVVESGSFVGAAERLEVSTAMVSKHVMSVEKRLGIRLLNRNSRTLSLTEPGRMYFERCKTILDDLQDAELELASFSTAPRGTLRISCPSWFATQRWANKLALFQRRYPDIIVDVSFEDRIVDLVEEGYDLALRVMADPETLSPQLIARPVRSMAFYVGASREYLRRNAAPESLDDLAHHGLVAVGNLNSWVFGVAQGKVEVPARTVVRYRSMAGVANAVAAGLGLAVHHHDGFILFEGHFIDQGQIDVEEIDHGQVLCPANLAVPGEPGRLTQARFDQVSQAYHAPEAVRVGLDMGDKGHLLVIR